MLIIHRSVRGSSFLFGPPVTVGSPSREQQGAKEREIEREKTRNGWTKWEDNPCQSVKTAILSCPVRPSFTGQDKGKRLKKTDTHSQTLQVTDQKDETEQNKRSAKREIEKTSPRATTICSSTSSTHQFSAGASVATTVSHECKNQKKVIDGNDQQAGRQTDIHTYREAISHKPASHCVSLSANPKKSDSFFSSCFVSLNPMTWRQRVILPT